MPRFGPGRFVLAGFGLVLCWGAPASAWDLFHGHGDTKKVKLPPQHVELQVAQPSIAVRERVTRGVVTTPVIGTLYMPLATPIIPFGLSGAAAPPTREFVESDPLARAHEAERHLLAHDRARAAFQAESAATQRAMSRMAPPAADSRDAKSCDAELSRRIQELGDRIDKLNDRLTAVERLLIVHDNYLQQQSQGGRNPTREMPEKLELPKPNVPLIPPVRGHDPLVPPVNPMGVEPKVPLVPPIK